MSRETEVLASRFSSPYKFITETYPLTTYVNNANGGLWIQSRILKRLERATFLQCAAIGGGSPPLTGMVVTGSCRSGMTSGGNMFQLGLYTGGASGLVELGNGAAIAQYAITALVEGV